MPSMFVRCHPNGHGEALSEIFRRHAHGAHPILIFIHVGHVLGRRGQIWTELGLAYEDHDIAPFAIAVKVKGDVGVCLDVLEFVGIGPTEDVKRLSVPVEPDGSRLRHPAL